jgi:hypothetical protein
VGAAVYDTSSTPFSSGGTDVFSDENSVMVRGALLAGMRAEAPTAAFGLWLGGGAESEIYDELTVDQFGNSHIKDNSDLHLMLTGRLRAQFPIVENVLGGRVRGDVLRHSITRDSVALDVEERATTTTAANSSVQLEASGRAFVDLSIAQFFGFVPAVEGGFDYFSLSDASGNVSATVPVLGVGIRRTEF